MAYSETLHFESARVLTNLYASEEAHLKEVEKVFGVRLVVRDHWLQIEGTKRSVAAVRQLFEQLHVAYHEKGIKIRKYDFRYAMQAVQTGIANKLSELWNTQITVSSKKAPIVAKTFVQQKYLKAIAQHSLVFGIGPAGTGKTFLAMAMAVAALKREEVNRIILTRPAVEAGEALGFLPGDFQQKIFPYLRPLYDALYDMLDADEVQRYIEKNIIEIAPLAYMRGRTLNQAFIILDEGQNTTGEQMLMLLTRLGTTSKCVVTGDPTQIDLPNSKRSGLIEALETLKSLPEIAVVQFAQTDVMRHELVTKIITAYQQYRR